MRYNVMLMKNKYNLWWDRVLGAGLGERSEEEDEDSMDYG